MVREKKPKIIRDKLKDKEDRKKHNKTIIKGRIIRDIRALFELKKEDYYE